MLVSHALDIETGCFASESVPKKNNEFSTARTKVLVLRSDALDIESGCIASESFHKKRSELSAARLKVLGLRSDARDIESGYIASESVVSDSSLSAARLKVLCSYQMHWILTLAMLPVRALRKVFLSLRQA